MYDPVSKSRKLFKDYQLNNMAARGKNRNRKEVRRNFKKYLERYHTFMSNVSKIDTARRTLNRPNGEPRSMGLRK